MRAKVDCPTIPSVSGGYKCKVTFLTHVNGGERVIDTYGGLFGTHEQAQAHAEEIHRALDILGIER